MLGRVDRLPMHAQAGTRPSNALLQTTRQDGGETTMSEVLTDEYEDVDELAVERVEHTTPPEALQIAIGWLVRRPGDED